MLWGLLRSLELILRVMGAIGGVEHETDSERKWQRLTTSSAHMARNGDLNTGAV